MKYILNFRLLFIAALSVVVSCDSADDDFSYLDDRQSVAYFAPGNSATLLVEDGATRFADVQVAVSEAKSFERTYTIAVDPSSEAVQGVDYMLPSTTFSIPANSVVGTFQVTSGDFAASTLTGKTARFSISEIEGSDILQTRNTFTLTVIRFCPIPDTYMVGDYAIADVAATIGPGNGTENFAAGTVTLTTTADPTERVFMSPTLPAFNTELETVVLSLSCGALKFSGVDMTLSCNGGASAYVFGEDTEAGNTYDLANDNNFTIVYIEDPNGSCGGPYSSSFSLTKL